MLLALLATAGLATAQEHQHEPPKVLAPGYGALQFVPPKVGSYQLPPLGEAADGKLLSSDNAAASLHQLLDGKITLISFIFTRCNDVNGCPLASFVLQGVQQQLRRNPVLADKVRLLSISFDRQNDTPAVLQKYAGNFRRPTDDWQFVVPASDEQLKMILDDYDQSVI